MAYSPDGKFLASGDEGGFKLWDAESLQELRTVATPALQLAFAADGRTLLAAATNFTARQVHTFTRWGVAAPKELPPLAAAVWGKPDQAHHYLGRDGKVLFVAQGFQPTYVRAIDTTTGKEVFPRRGHAAPLHAVAVRPGGRALASAGVDQAVKVWDLAAGRVRHSLSAHTDSVCGPAGGFRGRPA